MTNQPAQSIPAGYHTVTPFVIVKDGAGFINFMKAAFNAEELTRVADEKGIIGHAEVKIGDSVIMLFDSKPEWPVTPVFLRLYVDDVDATYDQALKAGGTSITKLSDMPWGDRSCRVGDPFGNLWWIMTRKETVSPEEESRRWSDPKYTDALNYFQSTDFFSFAKEKMDEQS
jgi:uncharacterized glyoxalase superfamily protein PhnB